MSVWRESARTLIVDIISRKFIVFICATVLLLLGAIKADSWLYISLGYMAANILESSVINYFNKVTS
jgi:uncharacterized membrane protein